MLGRSNSRHTTNKHSRGRYRLAILWMWAAGCGQAKPRPTSTRETKVKSESLSERPSKEEHLQKFHCDLVLALLHQPQPKPQGNLNYSFWLRNVSETNSLYFKFNDKLAL